ncbi:MAG: tetratricopeptide repeat protein [Fimbriimonas sp.]
MVRKTVLCFVVVLMGAVASAEVPRVLIVQMQVPVTKEGVDPNVPIADPLAQELDQGGKVSSIVWGVTDPVFRAAAADGKLKDVPDHPTLAQAQAAARALSAEFLLTCEARQNGSDVLADVRLLRGGRVVWKDKQPMRVSLGGGPTSRYDTARSIARTLAMRMQGEALKSLPVAAKIETAEPTKGQAPVVPVVPPVTPVDTSAADLARLRTEVQRLLGDGRRSAAILALRDGIDIKPLDPVRRKLLVDTLMESEPLLAAEEARRAAALAPEDSELRVLAARAWLRADRSAEAQADLNEAMARQPDSVPTRLLLAEIALRAGNGEQALEHVDRALKTEPGAEAYFVRAVCRATLGGLDGVKQDLAASQKASPEISPTDALRRYRLAAEVLDAEFDRLTVGFKNLMPKIAVKPKDAQLGETLEGMKALSEAQTALQDGLLVPAEVKASHARRVLARKLLGQVFMDLDAFVGGTGDAIADARISLGEAIKQMTTARETWSPTGNGATPGA